MLKGKKCRYSKFYKIYSLYQTFDTWNLLNFIRNKEFSKSNLQANVNFKAYIKQRDLYKLYCLLH